MVLRMPHGITLGQLYASDQWLEMLKDVSDVSEEFVTVTLDVTKYKLKELFRVYLYLSGMFILTFLHFSQRLYFNTKFRFGSRTWNPQTNVHNVMTFDIMTNIN